MCHFIWENNRCNSCGVCFDRKLTACKYAKPRTPRLACDRVYRPTNQPGFQCQECLLADIPWKRLGSSAEDEKYYSDDPKDGDYDGDESDREPSDNSECDDSDTDGEIGVPGRRRISTKETPRHRWDKASNRSETECRNQGSRVALF
ncbi:hypothetical protein LZ32DRAFT_610073, partial [Colletotrichum eremochloae]